MILETSRLVIRRMAEEDAPFILELLNDPSFISNIGDRQVRTLEQAREYIRTGPAASYEQHGFGLWLVELKDDGTPIGMCGLLKREALEHVEIGFAYLSRFRAKGYGFEAARAVLDYAREGLRLLRVTAIVSAHNDVSARLLEKLGMSFERMVQPFSEEPPLKLFATTPSAPACPPDTGG